MKSLVLILAILSAASLGSAQNQDRECPTEVFISGPAGITRPGDRMTFSLELKGSVPSNVQYDWTVSTGTIVEGQGTTKITVINDRKTSVTATVEIVGLADGCPNQISETAPYYEPLVAVLVAEGSSPVNKLDKARLNKLAAELAVSTGYQGYLIEYFPPSTSRQTIKVKTQLIRSHLRKLVDESRITIVIDTAEKPFTRYYIVPPGANNPTP